MLVPNQIVKVKWAYKTRKYYESKGYIFTDWGEEFDCKAEDLMLGSRYLVDVICDYCGKPFKRMNQYRKNGNLDYCKGSCSTYYSYTHNYKERRDAAFEKLELFCEYKGYKLITKRDDYIGTQMTIEYECPIHGYQTGILDNMTYNHGCIECKYMNDRISFEEMSNRVNKYNNNVLLSSVKSNKTQDYDLIIKCGNCGNPFNITYKGYISSNNKLCKTCASTNSGFEKIITNILLNNDISFKSEYTFKECRYINPLPFDFYLPKYNLCIEYDGEYHYMPLRISKNESEEDLNNRYQIIQKRDHIKDDYCKNHGIHLLRIPYWEKDNIEEIILNKIKELEEIPA